MEELEFVFNKFGKPIYTNGLVDEANDSALAAFFKGYVYADEDLEKYIRFYLWQYYNIDLNWNTWIQQVDHYAFSQGVTWEKGFKNLMNDILEYPYRLKELKYQSIYKYCIGQQFTHEPLNLENIQDYVHLKNGILIQIGNTIQLCDIIKEDYKKTKFYDISLRNPSWELFYPSEKDFEHISFYYEGDSQFHPFNFGRVRRLFSDSISVIKYIIIENETIFVYTDLFKIDIEKALENKEIILLDNIPSYTFINNFSNFINEMNTRMDNGSINSMATIFEFIDYWCFYHFNTFNKFWKKNTRLINGIWVEENK